MRGLILSGENSTRKKKNGGGGGGVEVVQNSPLNAHAEVTIRERCLTLDLSHYLHICFVTARSESAAESVRLHRLAWAFFTSLCF